MYTTLCVYVYIYIYIYRTSRSAILLGLMAGPHARNRQVVLFAHLIRSPEDDRVKNKSILPSGRRVRAGHRRVGRPSWDGIILLLETSCCQGANDTKHTTTKLENDNVWTWDVTYHFRSSTGNMYIQNWDLLHLHTRTHRELWQQFQNGFKVSEVGDILPVGTRRLWAS